ncbi:hypothetical protein B9Z55_011222 [Caenorhabditis nigoni]|uniref:C2H2-type domain-containing protein n=1 Tax=Caenorhabditis nigoni TaxID=1611254 RepID=A0A2G5UJ48_9PELO|nr:hypothetical protein B9Z55_011222 [Caenorhabditis nigoni]
MHRQDVDDYNQSLMVKYRKPNQKHLYECIYPLKSGETCKFVGDMEEVFEHAGEHSQCYHFRCSMCHIYFVTWRSVKDHRAKHRCWLVKATQPSHRARDHEEFIRKTFILPVKEEEVRTMNDQNQQTPGPSTSSIEFTQDPRIPSSSSNTPQQNLPAPGLIKNIDFEDYARILKAVNTGKSSESASTSKTPGLDCYQQRQLKKAKESSESHRAKTIEERSKQNEPEPEKEKVAPVSYSPIPIKKPRMSESVNLPPPSLPSTPNLPAASPIALPIHDFSVPPPPLGFGCLFPTDPRLNRPPATLQSPIPMATTNPVVPISPVQLPVFNHPPPMIPTSRRPSLPLPSLNLNLPAPCAVKFVNPNDPPEQLVTPPPIGDQSPEHGPQPSEAPVKLPRWKPLPPAPAEPPGIIRRFAVDEESNAAEAKLKKASSNTTKPPGIILKCPESEESNASGANLKKTSPNTSEEDAAARGIKTKPVDAPVEKTPSKGGPSTQAPKVPIPGKAPQPAKKKFSMKDVRFIKIEATDTDEAIHARHFPDLIRQRKQDQAKDADIVDPQANGEPSDMIPSVAQAPEEEMSQLQAQDADLQDSLKHEGSSNLGHEDSIQDEVAQDAPTSSVSMKNKGAASQQDQQAQHYEPQVVMENHMPSIVGLEMEIQSSSAEEGPTAEEPQEASEVQPSTSEENPEVPQEASQLQLPQAEEAPAMPPTRSIKQEPVEASAAQSRSSKKNPALPLNRPIKQEPADEDAPVIPEASKAPMCSSQEGSSDQVPQAAPTLQPPPAEKNPEMPRTIRIKQEPADDYGDAPVVIETPMSGSQVIPSQQDRASEAQVSIEEEGSSNQATSNIPPIPATRPIKPEPADDYEDVPATDSSEPGPSEPYRRQSRFDMPPNSFYAHSSIPNSCAPLPTPLQHHQDFFNDASGVFYQHPSWHQPSSSQDSAPDTSDQTTPTYQSPSIQSQMTSSSSNGQDPDMPHQNTSTSQRRYEERDQSQLISSSCNGHDPDMSHQNASTSPRHYEEQYQSQLTSSSSYDHDSAPVWDQVPAASDLQPSTSARRYEERDSSEEPELRIDEQACDEAWNLPTSSAVQKSPAAPRQIKSGTRKIAPSKSAAARISDPQGSTPIQTPSAAPERSMVPKTPRMIKSGTRKIAPSRIQVQIAKEVQAPAVPEVAPEVTADVHTPVVPVAASEVAAPKRRPRKKQKKITMPRKAARKPASSTSGSKRGRKKKVVVVDSEDLEPTEASSSSTLPKEEPPVIRHKGFKIKMMEPLTPEEELRLSQPSTPAATPSQGGSELPAELVGLLVPRRAATGAKRYREPSEEPPATKRKSLETDSTISSSFSTPRASADSEVKNSERFTDTAEKWSKEEEAGQDEAFLVPVHNFS